jgi:glycine/D-amino acid oxidase-like deaminating enzyme
MDQRIRVAGALAGLFSPHCARVQPAKLVLGLARVVEAMGVTIFEQTTVNRIEQGRAVTDRGTVRAPIVLRCLEGFTASIHGQRRNWLPMNSSMVVTAPLSQEASDQIGWRHAELLGDYAHGYMYAQRTADNRIALGGRGIPYRYGSRIDDRGATQEWTITA